MCMPKSLPPFLNLLQFQEQAQKSANTPRQANTKVVFEEAYQHLNAKKRMTTGQLTALTILLHMYCTGGTEMPQLHAQQPLIVVHVQ